MRPFASFRAASDILYVIIGGTAVADGVSCRYTGPNENFVLVSGCSSGDLETNGFEERIQAIADLLIEAVERTALFFR